MGLNPGIFRGAGEVNNSLNTFKDALTSLETGQQLRRNYRMMPLQDKLTDYQIKEAEFAIDNQDNANAIKQHKMFNERDTARINSLYVAANDIKRLMPAGPEAVSAYLMNRRQMLQKNGIDTTETDQALQMLSQPGGLEMLSNSADQTIDLYNRVSGKGNANYQKSTDGFVFDPTTGTYKQDPNYAEYKEYERQIKRDEFDRQQQVKLDNSTLSEQRKLASTRAEEAFDDMTNAQTALGNFDAALREINKGADTGWLESFFPSLSPATIALENIKGRMTMDVLNSVTFGALSEKELDFAGDTALPTDLQEDELYDWVKRKKLNTEIAMERFRDMARYLAKPDTTLNSWIKYSESKAYRSEVNARDKRIIESYDRYKYDPSAKNLKDMSDEELLEGM